MMMPPPAAIPAELPIAVTMDAQSWQHVLYVLNEAPVPHRIVAPLIQIIREQVMQAGTPAEQPGANGHDTIEARNGAGVS